MEPAEDHEVRSTRFGRYEALLRIGRGGMAEVFAGRVRGEAGFQKLVAVKRMLPHLADDEKFASMFLDEARLAANISSPHVVSTLDLGRSEDGSLYLVMELIIGVTLSSLLRSAAKEGKQIPVGVAVEILAQAAQGLHDAHEARTPAGTPLGIVHRDVSPQNVLIGADGRSRITDFGVARAMLRRTDTTTGELKGKLAYFSPEQVTDSQIDRRSDVFALGIVSWETFTGRRLFKAENPLALLDRITNMPIPPISMFNPDVPDDVDAVVRRAPERQRENRQASTQDFASELRAASRKHMALPDRPVMSVFVQQAAGDRLKKLEESIRLALDDTCASRPPGGPHSAYPDASSGVTTRSRTGETGDAKTGAKGAAASAAPRSGSSEPRSARSTAAWKPETNLAKKRASVPPPPPAAAAKSAAARTDGRGEGRSEPASAKATLDDDAPTRGSSRRPHDAETKDIVLPPDEPPGRGFDDMEGEATVMQGAVPLPVEAFQSSDGEEDGPTRAEGSGRYTGPRLGDDDDDAGATVQAASAYATDAPFRPEHTKITQEEMDAPGDGVAPNFHEENTVISGRESLGVPKPSSPGMAGAPLDPFAMSAHPIQSQAPGPQGQGFPGQGFPGQGFPGGGGAANYPPTAYPGMAGQPYGTPQQPFGFAAPPPPVPMAAQPSSGAKTIKRTAIVTVIALVVIGTAVAIATSGPSEEELRQQAETQARLEALKQEAENAVLEQQRIKAAYEAETRKHEDARKDEEARKVIAAAQEEEKRKQAEAERAKEAAEAKVVERKRERSRSASRGTRRTSSAAATDEPTPKKIETKPPPKKSGSGMAEEF